VNIKYLLVVLLVAVGCDKFKKDIPIPRVTIQEGLEKAFPYTKNIIIAKLTISDPVVYFKGENLGVKINYIASSIGKDYKGFADLYGEVYYRKDMGSFCMKGFKLVEASANDAYLSNNNKIQTAIESVMNNYLDKFPIYKLKVSEYKQNLARLLLQEIRIVGDKLIVKVGI
jgi:hypothetical protein